MRVPANVTFTNPEKEYSSSNISKILSQVSGLWNWVQTVFNGNITFGDATDIDNIKGLWVSGTSHVTPDTEFTITHNLGQIPVGFLDVGYKDKAGVFYRGSTAWTSTAIYLKCNTASVAYRIFILLGPQAP